MDKEIFDCAYEELQALADAHQYERQAELFCELTGLCISFEPDGVSSDNIGTRQHYAVELARPQLNKAAAFEFTGSVNDYERGEEYRAPGFAYDFLACVVKSDPQDLADFLEEYGYCASHRDGGGAARIREGIKVYGAVVDEWRKLGALFTEDEITLLSYIS